MSLRLPPVREVERHQRTAERICVLLDDLGEPHADPIA